MPQQSYPPRIGLPLMVIIPTTALVLGGIGYYRIQTNQEILPPIHIFFSELGIIAALILVPLLDFSCGPIDDWKSKQTKQPRQKRNITAFLRMRRKGSFKPQKMVVISARTQPWRESMGMIPHRN